MTHAWRVGATILSVAAVATSGPGLVAAALPERGDARVRQGLILSLGLAVGLGLWSALSLAQMLLGTRYVAGPLAGDVLMMIVGAVGVSIALKRRGVRLPGRSPQLPAEERRSPAMTAIFIVALLASAATFAIHVHRLPDGGWDAWCIWNLRARFMFSGAGRTFDPALPHADYPPLLPLLVAQAWGLAGNTSPTLPMIIAGIEAGLCVGILLFGVWWLRGPAAGLTAAIVLLGTPEFINHAAEQYADVPVACFLLGAVVLLAVALEMTTPGRAALIALAGVAAGLAALTKNEGGVEAFALFAGVGLASRGRRAVLPPPALRWIGCFIAGALPLLVPLIVFKIVYAPPNDLLSGRAAFAIPGETEPMGRRELAGEQDPARPPPLWTRFMQPRRYWTVIAALLIRMVRVDRWNVYLLGAAGSFLLAPCPGNDPRARRILGIVLMIVGLGLATAYIATPHGIDWQINTSMNRLILQIWPSLLTVVALRLTPKLKETPVSHCAPDQP